jgi:hypothetical protein
MKARFTVLPAVKKLNERAKRGASKSGQRSTPTYIYLIHMHDRIYMIGQSTDPHRRRNELQASSAYNLTLVHRFIADEPDMAKQLLQAHLAGHRMAGEWFQLSPRQSRVLATIDRYESGRFLDANGEVTLADLAMSEEEEP